MRSGAYFAAQMSWLMTRASGACSSDSTEMRKRPFRPEKRWKALLKKALFAFYPVSLKRLEGLDACSWTALKCGDDQKDHSLRSPHRAAIRRDAV